MAASGRQRTIGGKEKATPQDGFAKYFHNKAVK